MKTFIALFIAIFVGFAGAADDQRMRLVQPKGNALKLLQLKRDNDLVARYEGQIWVSGMLVGRWPDGAANLNYQRPEYVLVPDAESAAKLPHFILRHPPYFNRYLVESIELLNGPQALSQAVGETQAQRLQQRKTDQVHATGRFLLEEYSVGVECDAPWAKAVMVKAELPDQLTQISLLVPEGC